jgi:hypothetical protein
MQQRSPCRPLAWRWQRAERLVAQGMYISRKRDDEPTDDDVPF